MTINNIDSIVVHPKTDVELEELKSFLNDKGISFELSEDDSLYRVNEMSLAQEWLSEEDSRWDKVL